MTVAADPLVERWLAPEGTRLAEAVADALRRDRPLARLGLGTHDGRVDLRGIRFGAPKVTDRREIGRFHVEQLDRPLRLEKARLEGLDLTGAFVPGLYLDRCVVRDCVLDGAFAQKWAVFAGEIADTSFAKADLRSAGPLGAWHKRRPTTYTRCTFAGADLRGANVGVTDFVDCDFSHARLDNVELDEAGLVGCRFAGPLRDVVFGSTHHGTKRPGPNPFARNDFGDAVLDYTAFRGLDLTGCVLPRAPGHLVLRHWRCALERAVAIVRDDPSPAARHLGAVAGNLAPSASPGTGLIAESDLGEDAAGVAWAVALLRRCDAECGG